MFKNMYLQSLVEANQRRARETEEEKLLRQMEEEKIEDDVAEEQKAEADADADAALAELGEPTEEEIDDLEQDELERAAEEMENLEDPTDYDVSDDDELEEDELSDEELAALEAEDDQSQEEVPPDEVTPDGDPQAQTPEETIPPEEETVPPEEQPVDQQQPPLEPEEDLPPEEEVPEDQVDEELPPEEAPVEDGAEGEIPDFDYDDGTQPPAEGTEGAEGAGEDTMPPDGAEGDPNADPNAMAGAEDPNAAAAAEDPSLQNVQVNILNLSKLDRALAKKHIYTLFMDLRSSVTTALNIIDRNETVIEPEVRTEIISRLNQFKSDLDTFISIKFQLVNYEGALQAYNIFTEQFNSYIESIKNDVSANGSSEHGNKGGR